MTRHTSTTAFMAVLAGMIAFSPRDIPAAEVPPIKPGDAIVVLQDTHLQAGPRKLAPVESGAGLVASQVQGQWVAVTVERDGKKVSGWISNRQLVVQPQRAFAKLVCGYEAPVERPAEEFGRIDKDKDGLLTADEFLAGTRLQTLDDLNKQLMRVWGDGPSRPADRFILANRLGAEIGNFRWWKRQVDFDEVTQLERHFMKTRDIRRSHLAQELADRESPAVRAHRARVLFRWAEKTGDGKLTEQEFIGALVTGRKTVEPAPPPLPFEAAPPPTSSAPPNP